jgi:hypothetical protein
VETIRQRFQFSHVITPQLQIQYSFTAVLRKLTWTGLWRMDCTMAQFVVNQGSLL